ncbi:unnamed protein product [Trichobilharzia regenti]|nr:unnamed protein product [Trichobilharzia regenti]
MNRQSIYMSFICFADAMTILFFGVLWMIPAKGIPYATEGRVYYFILYQSVGLCRFHRGVYSFAATMAMVITVASILPFIILSDFHKVDKFTTCWLDESQVFLQIFSILFNNAGFVQTICVLLLNIIFMLKMRKTFTKDRLADPKSIESKEWSASVILFILAMTLLLFGLPQCAAYLAAFLFPMSMSGIHLKQSVRIAYNIADISWQCIFAQNASAIFVCWQRMHEFRVVTRRILCRHGPLKTKLDSEAQSTIG